MTKGSKRDKAPPKTSRQRKAEFDNYMRNRGGADPTRPERWGTVFFLTRESADWMARIREERRFEGSQPSQNAAIFEDMLRVYVESWSAGSGPAQRHPQALSSDRKSPTKLSTELAAFRASVEELSRTLLQIEAIEDYVLEAHEAERWNAFDRLTQRLQGLGPSGTVSIDKKRLWHREVDDYLHLLLNHVSEFAESSIKVPSGRGQLFRRVWQRLMA